jgi:hypothetical protein
MNPHSLPTRHGANRAEAERIARPLLWLIKDRTTAHPSEDQWQRMGEALLQGDAPADQLAEWIHGSGGKAAFRQFGDILDESSFNQSNLPQPLRTFFNAVSRPPAWVDWERLERGAQACALSGKTGMRVLRDLGLMAGYQASGINQTLIATGALKQGASRWVAETTKWWMDCTTPGGMKAGADGFKTTLRVRLIHAMIRQGLLKQQDWEIEHWGLPINQLDMQATYLAFSVSFLFGQKLMGTIVSRREAEDIMHLWRYIGWLMGVDNTLLCSSEREGRIALYQNLTTQATADENSRHLGRALMDEPLGRHYANAAWFRGRWERQVHLSLVRWFVGRRGMKALGLPESTLPWYPLLFTPMNILWCTIHRFVPGGRARLQVAGRQAQHHQLQTLFGKNRPDITAS